MCISFSHRHIFEAEQVIWRENREHPETRECQMKVGLLSSYKGSRNNWCGRRQSTHWAGDEEIPGGGGLDLGLPGVELMI